jgi:hypothetical protein
VASDNVFGSDELTPELLRSAQFNEQDGRIDAAEVRTFLDRVASSLEVFLSADAPSALRAEFARNAEIAQQVLDAGQNAAEQLRRQAAEEARAVLDDTRAATEQLRGEMEGEIRQSREQVEAMRGQFIQDLRDLYDRIGASLYRFERAAEETNVAPIQEPSRAEAAPAPEAEPEPQAAAAPESAHEFEMPEPALPELHPAAELGVTPTTAGEALEQPVDQPVAPPAAVELPEGAKPPAWQQLPPEAWASGSEETSTEPAEAPAMAAAAELATGPDEFAVIEDEPLAPGEPLVDLRDMQGLDPSPELQGSAPQPAAEEPAANAAVEPVADAAAEPAADSLGGSWLEAAETPADAAPEGAPAPTPEPEVVEAAPPAAEGGSWLLDEPADIAGTADSAVAHDDALAEALIAGTPFGEEEGSSNGAAAADTPPPLAGEAEPLAGASPDAVAVRQLILDSLAAGQSRDAIESYLRDHMGFMEPGALVDAAITAAGNA